MASAISNWLALLARRERRLERPLSAFFQGQGKRLLVAAGGLSSLSPSVVPQLLSAVDDHAKLMEAVRPHLADSIATGAARMLAQRPASRRGPSEQKAIEIEGFSLDDFELPSRVRDAVESTFEDLIEQDFWQTIQDGTRELVTSVLRDAIAEGLSESAKKKLLRETFAGMSKVRAKAIARTETTGALNAGHQAAFDGLSADGTITGKRWLSIVDQDTRQSHSDADGQLVGPQDEFKIGESTAQYPGAVTLPATERILCRCTMVAVFD